jgi:glucose/arabinose dehydrogenase
MSMRNRSYLLEISLFGALLGAGLAGCGDDGNGGGGDGGRKDAAQGDGSAPPPTDGRQPPDARTGPAPDAFVSDCTPVSGTALTTKLIASEPDINQAVFVTSPSGDPRLFVVERCGIIRIIEDGAVLAKPFLDISLISDQPRVDCSSDEEGLLGLAFHPSYRTNGRFFIKYTRTIDGNRSNLVAEYHVSSDPNVADVTEKEIIDIPQPQANHNSGMVAFGPDGYLYVGTGDGGGSGDPDDNGQDNKTLLAAILRLDVNGGDPYAIPAANPYASSANGPQDPRPELWAIGLRNPWRFSFDRATGDLYIGDVGQGDWEEINVQPATSAGGENYGWNIYEGTHCFPPGTSSCDPAGMTMPVAEYVHRDIDANHRDKSVTGGYVYRGRCIPDIQGWYFYADFGSDIVRTFEYRDGEAQGNRELDVNFGERIVSFGEDAAGEMYVVGVSPDRIYQIVPAPAQ